MELLILIKYYKHDTPTELENLITFLWLLMGYYS
ncbi:hypothetical protein SAMN05216464_102320 [Mucilaginibacter pineti]|uniref:Uncharacterized protein n=1 Tax=Mucilaginibacter pineti TaxID=1391627 RepID=A0A1G6WYF4_9SPHI|nr:hypothetical protein SAMN05216464_102320 [Mucilaginibacter pineti]